MIEFKGSHFERDVILWGVRWYVAYPISYRQLEEMMEERGVEVDHSTLNRWVFKYVPLLDQQFRARKRQVGSSWRLGETYVKVKGCWKYLYRAVDKAGGTVDFLLTAKRDRKAALRFLQTIISIEPDPGTNTQLRSHFLGALLQIGADQGHEHGTEGEGPCPRLLGQIAQVAAGARYSATTWRGRCCSVSNVVNEIARVYRSTT